LFLTEWVQQGCYDLSKRKLIATTSPAMDILKSSNVERVLFDLFGAARTRELMRQLDADGRYQLDAAEHAQVREIFAAGDCSDAEGKQYIRQAFEQGYLLDPHTATCFKTCNDAQFAGQVNIIYSTAEWTKFAVVVDNAINGSHAESDQQALAAVAERAGIAVPPMIAGLFERPIVHPVVVDKDDIESEILNFLEHGG